MIRQAGQRPRGGSSGSGFPHRGQTWSCIIVGSPRSSGIQWASARKSSLISCWKSPGSASVRAISSWSRARNRFRSLWTATFTAPLVIPSSARELGIRRRVALAHQGGLQALEKRPLVLAVDFARRAGRARERAASAPTAVRTGARVSPRARARGGNYFPRPENRLTGGGSCPPLVPLVPVPPVRKEVLE